MHIHGLSAEPAKHSFVSARVAGLRCDPLSLTPRGRHGTGRQQYRVRDSAEEQHGRHILPVNAYSEMQTDFDAVTGLESSDQLSARHRVAD
jgi:hypothetical protein